MVVAENTPRAEIRGHLAICPGCQSVLTSRKGAEPFAKPDVRDDGTMFLASREDYVAVRLLPRRVRLKLGIHVAVVFLLFAGAVAPAVQLVQQQGFISSMELFKLVSALLGFYVILGFSAVSCTMSVDAVLTPKALTIRRSWWKWRWQSITPAERVLYVNVREMSWGSKDPYRSLEDRLNTKYAVNFELKDGFIRHKYIASNRTPEERAAIASAFDSFLKKHMFACASNER
jgi:hypothetical protein